ncbi:hypothetical protein BJX61DRAFT_489781 [Aspergillus egyptiacus]|nr:hypothetical protein BJX61DRAFT_489781 [Aspergillus egyptiacus]
MSMNKIQPLPSEVAAKIQSSTSITHLNGVIVELVKNALDASAHTVHITVDYRRGGCIVEDDGVGILPAEFEAEGGLGKVHHTSKLNPESPVYGRKGCFLASLSALALLTVTSHHVHHASTNTVIFHHSSPVARLVPAPKHHGLRFNDHGTRVTVNDLFGNMPVRVKSRALRLQKPDELDRQWDELRQLLVSLMVSNPSLLKLVIADTDKERKLTIRPSHISRSDSGLDLARFNSILSSAGLIDTHTNSWHLVSATVPQLAINAALSPFPSPSKKVQFISFGIDPVFSQNKSNILYNEVNRLFAMSDFGTSGGSLYAVHRDSGPDGHFSARPVPKAVNKWPMFYIRIDAEGDTLSNTDQERPESDKSLQRILDVVTLMVNEYLKEHGMRPRGSRRKRQGVDIEETRSAVGTGTTTARPSTTSSPELSGKQMKLPSFPRPSVSGHFGNWSRVKSGNSHSKGTVVHEKDEPCLALVSTLDNQSTDNQVVRPWTAPLETAAGGEGSDTVERELSANSQAGRGGLETDTVVPWVDPYTGIRHWINSRTGQSVNVRPSAAWALANRPKSTGSFMAKRVLDHSRPASAIPLGQNTWFENILDNWKNPVFGRAERPISALDTETEHESPDTSGHSFHETCSLDSFGVSRYRGKLRKQDLGEAKVIGQVDRKSIMVEISSGSDACSLALIDQHAADERCRVESLFEEFVAGPHGVQTIEVDPIILEIPTAELILLRKQAGFFKSWGVEYEIERDPQSNKMLIAVSRLPTLIAERCRTEPDLILNIIRGEIWKRTEDGGRSSPAVGKPEHSEGWVARLAGCPQGIVDLLNSRACRTAVMFNDVLSLDECQSLVKRLAHCVFPFQCAHGRPSMVPTVDLRTFEPQLGDHAGIDEAEYSGYSEAFKRWQLRQTR